MCLYDEYYWRFNLWVGVPSSTLFGPAAKWPGAVLPWGACLIDYEGTSPRTSKLKEWLKRATERNHTKIISTNLYKIKKTQVTDLIANLLHTNFLLTRRISRQISANPIGRSSISFSWFLLFESEKLFFWRISSIFDWKFDWNFDRIFFS